MEGSTEAMAESQIDGVTIHSGFPNSAADTASARPALDLNNLLIKNPSSTFIFRIRGHQWADRGIFDGDLAIIDRALSPRGNDLVIAWDEQTFTLTPFFKLKRSTEPRGVVTAIIHQYRKAA